MARVGPPDRRGARRRPDLRRRTPTGARRCPAPGSSPRRSRSARRRAGGTTSRCPARHGIAQTVGDSVGPGGVLRALRHVPELVAIARDVADLAPGAQLVNYSNPLTANVRGDRRRRPPVRVDRAVPRHHAHPRRAGRATSGVPARRGARHLRRAQPPVLAARPAPRRGGPLPAAARAGRASGPAAADAPSTRHEGVHLPVSADLLPDVRPLPGARRPARRGVLRLVPARRRRPGRRLPWGLQGGRDDDDGVHRPEGRPVGAAARPGRRRRLPLDGPRQPGGRAAGGDRRGASSPGDEHVELAVNLPNEGKISNLPPEAVVEVPAVVGAAGVTGLAVGPLPDGDRRRADRPRAAAGADRAGRAVRRAARWPSRRWPSTRWCPIRAIARGDPGRRHRAPTAGP